MMKLENSNSNNLSIVFSKQELVVLSNAIRETVKEIEEWEFFTRTGTEPGEASLLLKKITGILHYSGEKTEFSVEITRHELLIFHSSLAEVTAGFHIENFEQRIGISIQDAMLLHQQMQKFFKH